VRILFSWLSAVVVCTSAGALNALAADLGAAKSTNDDSSETIETIAIDSSLTTATHSTFGDLGILFAPYGGLDVSGFRTHVGTNDGEYSYIDTDSGMRVHGLGEEADISMGYEWSFESNKIFDSSSLLLLGGLNMQTDRLDMTDPSNPVQGTRYGFKTSVEFYSNPTEKTLFSAQGEYSTAFNAYYTEFNAGYAAFAPEVFLGPTLSFLGDDHYQQWRVGGGIWGPKLGRIEFNFQGGFMHDHEQGDGAFATVGAYVRY
jgi:hypothetical protein